MFPFNEPVLLEALAAAAVRKALLASLVLRAGLSIVRPARSTRRRKGLGRSSSSTSERPFVSETGGAIEVGFSKGGADWAASFSSDDVLRLPIVGTAVGQEVDETTGKVGGRNVTTDGRRSLLTGGPDGESKVGPLSSSGEDGISSSRTFNFSYWSMSFPNPWKSRTGELFRRSRRWSGWGVGTASPVLVIMTPFIADWGSESVLEWAFEPKDIGVRNLLRCLPLEIESGGLFGVSSPGSLFSFLWWSRRFLNDIE